MISPTLTFEEFMRSGQQRCELTLEKWLPQSTQPTALLHEAMRYSVLGGGKRIRPLLSYATAIALGATLNNIDDAAIAVELVHAYSLVHDDLPAMDDDDLRRGKPSCHKAYDEATAILVGDALQTLAFEVLATSKELTPQQSLAMIQVLAKAAGKDGMVGGQMLDMAAENKTLTLEELTLLHQKKTGALISASIQIGAIAANASQTQIQSCQQFAELIGLAFQVQDDVLDCITDTAQLGKPSGSDVNNHKATFVSLLGLEKAKQQAQSLLDQALAKLNEFEDSADLLRQLAGYIIQRDY